MSELPPMEQVKCWWPRKQLTEPVLHFFWNWLKRCESIIYHQVWSHVEQQKTKKKEWENFEDANKPEETVKNNKNFKK